MSLPQHPSGFVPVRPREDLGRLEGYHSPQVQCSVRLNTNESPVPPPPTWQQQLAQEVAALEFHRYPDREAVELRRSIAELHGLDVANVFVANGSNEVLQTLCLSYGGPGRTALTFEPTYAMHGQIARVCATTVVERQRAEGFRIDLASMAAALEEVDPHIVFVCSPNNPTGNLIDDDVLDHVVVHARGLIVVDEAYGQFAPRSAQRFLAEDRNLVVVRTFSKTWAMAGQRLGYCLGPTWLIDQLHQVVLPYHLDIVKQAAGRLALQFEPQMRARVEQLVAERNRLQTRLGELPVTVFDSAANFILFRVHGRSASDVWADLVARSVLVRNCGSWPGLDGCLRVTIGTPDEDDAFLEALAAVLNP